MSILTLLRTGTNHLVCLLFVKTKYWIAGNNDLNSYYWPLFKIIWNSIYTWAHLRQRQLISFLKCLQYECNAISWYFKTNKIKWSDACTWCKPVTDHILLINLALSAWSTDKHVSSFLALCSKMDRRTIHSKWWSCLKRVPVSQRESPVCLVLDLKDWNSCEMVVCGRARSSQPFLYLEQVWLAQDNSNFPTPPVSL